MAKAYEEMTVLEYLKGEEKRLVSSIAEELVYLTPQYGDRQVIDNLQRRLYKVREEIRSLEE